MSPAGNRLPAKLFCLRKTIKTVSLEIGKGEAFGEEGRKTTFVSIFFAFFPKPFRKSEAFAILLANLMGMLKGSWCPLEILSLSLKKRGILNQSFGG